MNWKCVFRIIGILILFLSAAMVVPTIASIYYNDNIYTFLISTFLPLSVGISLYLIFKKDNEMKNLRQKECIAIVSIGWLTISFFGAFPFYISSKNFIFADAFFESVSGFTTTGASILQEIETQPKSILLWRSFIQWLGGMGIIVLSIAILPLIRASGNKLYNAEIPSPIPDKITPKIKNTAIILWKFYIFFSVAEIILLMIGKVNFFDAMCHTFTTMPTGGFSTKDISIKHYNSLYIDSVLMLFMIIGGINFSLYYQLIRGKTFIFLQDTECKFFLLICIILSVLISFNLHKDIYSSFAESLRYSTFQVISILTTTGYITSNYELWPPMSKLIINTCMFIGASAGSTSGGMKCLRIILCLKYCYKELFTTLHPRAVTQIKINGEPIPDRIVRRIIAYLGLYIILFVLFSILLSVIGVDITTALSSVAASIGNIGPGFGEVAPSKNYSLLPNSGKYILTFCMLLGRLEIYTLIVLIIPEFWRK